MLEVVYDVRVIWLVCWICLIVWDLECVIDRGVLLWVLVFLIVGGVRFGWIVSMGLNVVK